MERPMSSVAACGFGGGRSMPECFMSLYTINHGPCAMRSVNDSKMYLFNVSQCLTLSEPPEGRLALGIAIGSIGQGIEPGHREGSARASSRRVRGGERKSHRKLRVHTDEILPLRSHAPCDHYLLPQCMLKAQQNDARSHAPWRWHVGGVLPASIQTSRGA